MNRREAFPLGAAVTLAQLEECPHSLLARLRDQEPVSWVPALEGWLVTRHDLALSVMRDPNSFTVQDPRFSTAQVIGPSMLSLDGELHALHRAPFVAPFRPAAVRERFEQATAAEARRLVRELAGAGAGELRRSFAGPLATSVICRILGLEQTEVNTVHEWYDAIVGAVTSITAGHGSTSAGRAAYRALGNRLRAVIEGSSEGSLLAAASSSSDLGNEQLVSNAAVLLFGAIETTQGMIATALLHLLERPEELARVASDTALLDSAIEESLRLEPAAAVVDRYAVSDVRLGDAAIERGDLVRVSISAANRDPRVFEHPDRFEPGRREVRRHIAFAHGPHVCLGIHLARLEARIAVMTLLQGLPALRLDPDRASPVRGLVFRKPEELHARWD